MSAKIALAAAKSRPPVSACRRRLRVAAIVLAPAMMFFSRGALADENGISFWVPGFFGSLAATPQQAGWSLATIYYHTSVSAGAGFPRPREFTLRGGSGKLNLQPKLNFYLKAPRGPRFVVP